jgi:CRP-like cAMP-binding protein
MTASTTPNPMSPLLDQILRAPAAVGPRAALCARLEALGVPAAGGAWASTVRLAAGRGQFAVALALTLRRTTGSTQAALLRELAERYGAERPRSGARVPPPIAAPRVETVPADEDAQIALALSVLADRTGLVLPADAPVPEIPLFSALRPAAFVEVARALTEVAFQPGAALIRQGETDRTLYLLAQGQVRVEVRRADGEVTALAVALAPALLGEISLLTAVPRRASVVALEPVLAWRLGAAAVERLGAENPEVRAQLEHIVKQRLLQNVLRTSRLFAATGGVPDVLVPAFQLRSVAAGDEVFAQGAPSPGLFVVLHGHAEVWTRGEDGDHIRVATLSEGDAFGEFSLLTGQPTTAAVRMPDGGALLHLSASNFKRLRPQLGRLETGLTELMEVRRTELDELVGLVESAGAAGTDFEVVDDAWLLAD